MRAIVVFLSLVGCTRTTTPPPPPAAPAPAPSMTTSPTSSASPDVGTFAHVGHWLGKPPMAEQYFDVTLRNPSAAEARWLVVPSVFGDPWPGADDSEVQIYVVSERPRVVLFKSVGSHVYAVRLPPGGVVTLRKLPIASWWGTPPPTAEVVVLVARAISLGGEDLARVAGVSVASESGADVEAPRNASDARAAKFWHPDGGPGYRAAPITFDVESRRSYAVPITS